MIKKNNSVKIKHGKEWVVQSGHPWIYAEAVEPAYLSSQENNGENDGEVVDVFSSSGFFLAQGFFNSKSAIALRILTRDKADIIDTDWIRKKIEASIERRKLWINENNQIARMVSFEADDLPGLVIDRYGDWWIFQILSAGMENFRDTIIDTIKSFLPKGIIERSDDSVREKEGLPLRKALIFGELPESYVAKENGLLYNLDFWRGHKTGFYIDQRINRLKLSQLGECKRVLNCFCYTGGFSLSVLKGGAKEVTSVDSSRFALEGLEKNFILNGIDPDHHHQIEGDVFKVLEHLAGEEPFDGVILDPPKFAGQKKHLKNALKGYKELNALGWKIVKPGGWLATFTCSGRISREDFQKTVEGAILNSKHPGYITDWMSQSPDHTVKSGFPESLYLKGLLISKTKV